MIQNVAVAAAPCYLKSVAMPGRLRDTIDPSTPQVSTLMAYNIYICSALPIKILSRL